MLSGAWLASKAGEDAPKTELDEPLAIHRLGILAETKEEKHHKPNRNLEPAIESDDPACRKQADNVPVGVNSVPAVLGVRELGCIRNQDIELHRENDQYEYDGQPEQAHESRFGQVGIRGAEDLGELFAVFMHPKHDHHFKMVSGRNVNEGVRRSLQLL